jgi:hypothetical protein
VRDGLDFQEATIGRKADLPESGQVPQAFPDIEIHGMVENVEANQPRIQVAARNSQLCPGGHSIPTF